MIRKWLEMDAKITLFCVLLSVAALLIRLAPVPLFSVVDPAFIAIILCGVPILSEAAQGLFLRGDIKADLLVSMALLASVATKEFFAAGEVALIMQIGSLLEDMTAGKAKKGLEKLMNQTPQILHLALSDGKWEDIEAKAAKPGNQLYVLDGEMVPVDGKIVEGRASLDQSMMTGESLPVDKKPGDEVFSGCINRAGVFRMEVTRSNEESSMQRMIRLAKEAEEKKAPIVTLADRWASGLVVVALLCAIIAWITTGIFERAVTVLVVFCPCAFILATPTAVLAGIANAARRGILLRSGAALEKLSGISAAAFDKTGTLTQGRLDVRDILSFDSDFSKEQILQLAAGLEKYSDHPLAKAIVRAAGAGSIPEDTNNPLIPEADDMHAKASIPEDTNPPVIPAADSTHADTAIPEDTNSPLIPTAVGTHTKADKEKRNGETVSHPEILPGYGISGEFSGRRLLAGKAELMESRGLILPEGSGRKKGTSVYVALEDQVIGAIYLADQIRPETAGAVECLKEMGIPPMLLSGDNVQEAQVIAGQAGIPSVYADLLPENKKDILEQLQRQGMRICMVGDGVNDALAMAGADAGIAMGGIGSDVTVESADAVLVEDDIRKIPYIFYLTRRVMGNIRTNIIASLLINLTAVILSIAGVLTPVTGALWHNFGSVFVILRAAGILLYKEKETAFAPVISERT